MKTPYKYLIILLFSFIGLGVSVYLTLSHYQGFLVPCNVTHGCETVLASKYAVVAGVPVAVMGVAFFLSLALLSVIAKFKPWAQTSLTVILSVGVLVSLILLGLQFFIIKKVCQYCFSVDTITIALFLWDLNTVVGGGGEGKE